MKKLLKIYEEILNFASMKVEKNGEVWSDFDVNKNCQIEIDKKKLVMPYDEQLEHYNPEKMVVFHPFQEHVNKGESEVVRRLRQHLNVRINYLTMSLAQDLLILAASSSEHNKLDPEQRELLKAVKGVDAKSAKNFGDFVVKHYASRPANFFTNIYLKKAGTFRGEKHSRVGVVSFPFYEFLDSDEVSFSRKIDKETFESLLSFIFPGSEVENSEEWNSYSDSRDIPWLHCLLTTAHGLLSRLGELFERYRDWVGDADDVLSKNAAFTDEWVEALSDLSEYRSEIRRLPSQKGNEGSLEEKEEAVRRPEPVQQSRRIEAPQRQIERPVERPVPERREALSEGPYHVDSAPPPTRPPYDPRQPYPVAQHHQGHHGYPDPYYHPHQAPPQATSPVTAEGKLDFKALMDNNPAIRAAAMTPTVLTEWDHRRGADPRLAPPGYDPRYDPRLAQAYDPRLPPPGYDPRYDPRAQAAYDPRYDPRVAQQAYDPRYDPRVQPQYDPRYDPRVAPGYDPRYDPRSAYPRNV